MTYLKAQGIKEGRLFKYAYSLIQINKFLGKDFDMAYKEDIIGVVGKIENNERYSDWTKREYKIILRKFYKWLRQTEDYPPEVKWIKIKDIKINEKLFGKILTKEEVEKLANTCENPRDRALILVLFESGCRIGEILPLKIGDVRFDNYGIKFVVSGKTGSRWIRIFEYQKSLKNG